MSMKVYKFRERRRGPSGQWEALIKSTACVELSETELDFDFFYFLCVCDEILTRAFLLMRRPQTTHDCLEWQPFVRMYSRDRRRENTLAFSPFEGAAAAMLFS